MVCTGVERGLAALRADLAIRSGFGGVAAGLFGAAALGRLCVCVGGRRSGVGLGRLVPRAGCGRALLAGGCGLLDGLAVRGLTGVVCWRGGLATLRWCAVVAAAGFCGWALCLIGGVSCEEAGDVAAAVVGFAFLGLVASCGVVLVVGLCAPVLSSCAAVALVVPGLGVGRP